MKLYLILFIIIYIGCKSKPTGIISNPNIRYEKTRNLELKTESTYANNIQLYDRKNSRIKLSELFNGSQMKLVYHYSEDCCFPCAKYFLGIVDSLSEEYNSKIITIAYNFDEMEAKVHHAEIGYETNFFRTDEYLDIYVNDTLESRPFFLLVDQNLKITKAKICHMDDANTNEFINNPYLKLSKL